MKLRNILESYADLPDEDEFSNEPVCDGCGNEMLNWGSECDCEAEYCKQCLEAHPESFKFEKRGIGWNDEMGLRTAYEQGDPMPMEYEALMQCPECTFKAEPFQESYEGLPDADHFSNEENCEGCDYPEYRVGQFKECRACGGWFCQQCMPVHYSFGFDGVNRVWQHCAGAE
jgi:hypothetical protein